MQGTSPTAASDKATNMPRHKLEGQIAPTFLEGRVIPDEKGEGKDDPASWLLTHKSAELTVRAALRDDTIMRDRGKGCDNTPRPSADLAVKWTRDDE